MRSPSFSLFVVLGALACTLRAAPSPYCQGAADVQVDLANRLVTCIWSKHTAGQFTVPSHYVENIDFDLLGGDGGSLFTQRTGPRTNLGGAGARFQVKGYPVKPGDTFTIFPGEKGGSTGVLQPAANTYTNYYIDYTGAKIQSSSGGLPGRSLFGLAAYGGYGGDGKSASGSDGGYGPGGSGSGSSSVIVDAHGKFIFVAASGGGTTYSEGRQGGSAGTPGTANMLATPGKAGDATQGPPATSGRGAPAGLQGSTNSAAQGGKAYYYNAYNGNAGSNSDGLTLSAGTKGGFAGTAREGGGAGGAGLNSAGSGAGDFVAGSGGGGASFSSREDLTVVIGTSPSTSNPDPFISVTFATGPIMSNTPFNDRLRRQKRARLERARALYFGTH